MITRACLYRHYAADGTLLYVGLANSALQRLNAHRSKSSWIDQIARVEIEWFESRGEAHAAERAAINEECPKHNRILYKPKPVRAPRVRAEDAGPARVTKARRLESAGYVYVSGWLPTGDPIGSEFDAQVDMHREDVERIAETAPRRGRPKKEDRK